MAIQLRQNRCSIVTGKASISGEGCVAGFYARFCVARRFSIVLGLPLDRKADSLGHDIPDESVREPVLTPKTSLSSDEVSPITAELSAANQEFMRRYPGESERRQAVHTVYGGAHLFKADSARRLGEVALRSLREFAPDAKSLMSALDLSIDPALMHKIYDRIVEKLEREPVEDFRLDFDDGYGNRPDAEEDQHAHSS